MTKNSDTAADPSVSTETVQPAAPDPMEAGMTSIRTADPDALRIWSVKGPKVQPGSEIFGVLTDGAVVVVHQLASGKFTVYDKRS